MLDERIFKAYDIRGIYPTQLDDKTAYLIGGATVNVISAKRVVVGRDVRISSKSLERALIRGLSDAGATVDILGEISTDAMYYAVGKYGYDAGVMVTASHNPPEYNGFKISKADAIPLSGDSGLPEIKRIVKLGKFRISRYPGSIQSRQILDEYVRHCLGFINLKNLKPFRIAIDAANGVAGIVLEKILPLLPFKVEKLFFEPDGNFPNHFPNPMAPENTEVLRKEVLKKHFDFGVAFDGDADRMFLIDEKGNFVSGDMIVAMVARKMLRQESGSAIVHNLICSKTVIDVINKYHGIPIRSRVGHAFLKPLMRENNAIFGGEHSGHYFFRDHWFADSGLIAFLVVAEVISEEEKSISQVIADIDRYYRTGEINTEVRDRWETLECVVAKVSELTGVEPDRLDGITFTYDNWWFNIRPSNTEPLLRLNIEADSPELRDEKLRWVLDIINECK